MEDNDNEELHIAGIQHFIFCQRQWGLAYIDGEWQENGLTMGGHLIHENAHNPQLVEKRDQLLVTHELPLKSARYHLYGYSDVVEFRETNQGEGIPIPNYKGFWLPVPVEYKHGKLKRDHSDSLQLLAQAICLEEMLDVKITFGELFYKQTQRRQQILFTDDLRTELAQTIQQMRKLQLEQRIPKGRLSPKCRSCSLYDICQPELFDQKSPDDFLRKELNRYA